MDYVFVASPFGMRSGKRRSRTFDDRRFPLVHWPLAFPGDGLICPGPNSRWLVGRLIGWFLRMPDPWFNDERQRSMAELMMIHWVWSTWKEIEHNTDDIYVYCYNFKGTLRNEVFGMRTIESLLILNTTTLPGSSRLGTCFPSCESLTGRGQGICIVPAGTRHWWSRVVSAPYRSGLWKEHVVGRWCLVSL